MKQLLTNKKGYSLGFALMIFLAVLFVGGLMYFMFFDVFDQYMLPMNSNITAANLNASQAAEINANITDYMTLFKMIPFVIIGVCILFLASNAMRSRNQNE